MGIQVEIVSLLQKVDLETMLMSNQLVMRLPNGDEVKLSVSDEETAKIINARAGNLPSPTQEETQDSREPSQPFQSTTLSPGSSSEAAAFEFGGGDTQEPAVAEEPVVPRRRPQVIKNEFGYPVVQGKEGRDPGEIVSTDGPKDEDGVGSI